VEDALAEQQGSASQILPPAPLPRSAAAEAPCKICATPSPILDVVDFQKNCHESRGVSLPLSGRPVYYYRCPHCGFLFTCDFDRWTSEDFARFIYNGDYSVVDPDYAELRPRTNATALQAAFGDRLKGLKLLDFGGGNGLFAAILREAGLDATSFDPFGDKMATPPPDRQFDLVTAYEVFEHAVDPAGCLQEISRLLKPDGLLYFSTLINDGKDGRAGIGSRLTWWYASPRNGHIALHSRRSLTLLLRQLGFAFVSFNDLTHAGFRQLPSFASHLIKRVS
jgi:2-polyprenyl-6-hydroxyphenyl methylase/3-demethylubiquinone-9 3-methyltransferase